MRFQIFLAILLVFFGVILITAAFFVPNNPRHGLYQAGIQQAAFLHPPRHSLCCKVRHDYKRGGGDKRERSREDSTTAQVLQILPHLHLRLHLSSLSALFPNKNQIQTIGCQSVKVSKCQTHFWFSTSASSIVWRIWKCRTYSAALIFKLHMHKALIICHYVIMSIRV